MDKQTCPSEWALSLWYTCESDQETQQRISSHIAQCPICQQRVLDMDAHSEQTLSLYLEFSQARPIQQAVDAPTTSKRPFLAIVQEWLQHSSSPLAVGSICMFALFLLYSLSTPTIRTTTPFPSPTTPPAPRRLQANPYRLAFSPKRTSKGTQVFRMLYHYKGSKRTRWVRHREPLQPGALIQFVVGVDKPSHIMIISVDARSVVSLIWPFTQKTSAFVTKGTKTLPAKEALELDKTLGKELFFLLSSSSSFHYQDAKKLLQNVMQKPNQLQSMHTKWRINTISIVKKAKP